MSKITTVLTWLSKIGRACSLLSNAGQEVITLFED